MNILDIVNVIYNNTVSNTCHNLNITKLDILEKILKC